MDSTTIRTAIADHVTRIKAINGRVEAGKRVTKDDLRFLGLEKSEVKLGRPTKGTQELPIYGSMGACVAATGLPLFLIKQAKAEGCEAFRYSRVDLAKLLAHLGNQFAHPDKHTSDGDADAGNWRQVFEKYRAMREKARWSREEKEVISKDDVRTSMATGVSELYSALDRIFCNELPPTLIGLSEIEIRNRCKAEINQMKDAVRKRFESYVTATGAVADESSESSEDADSENAEVSASDDENQKPK